MRRRRTIRKAVKTAIIAKTARHIGRRAEEHLEEQLKSRVGVHLRQH